jgi:hypothetical protein
MLRELEEATREVASWPASLKRSERILEPRDDDRARAAQGGTDRG